MSFVLNSNHKQKQKSCPCYNCNYLYMDALMYGRCGNLCCVEHNLNNNNLVIDDYGCYVASCDSFEKKKRR